MRPPAVTPKQPHPISIAPPSLREDRQDSVRAARPSAVKRSTASTGQADRIGHLLDGVADETVEDLGRYRWYAERLVQAQCDGVVRIRPSTPRVRICSRPRCDTVPP